MESGTPNQFTDCTALELRRSTNPPWTWGSKISRQLLLDGLRLTKVHFRGVVLDIGCGSKPYQGELGGSVSQWLGVDFADTPSGHSAADVFADALELPFATGVVDTVLSTQTLEHVREPSRFLQEAQRVLRNGGYLVLSAPQTNHLHEEPHDFFRFTSHGLRLLAEGAGLEVLETRALGGAIATVGQMLVWHMNWMRRIPVVGAALFPALNAALAWAVLTLDRVSHMYGGGAMKDTINWLLIARKPESGISPVSV